MKRLLSMMLAAVMVVSMAACSSQAPAQTETAADAAVQTAAAQTAAAAVPEAAASDEPVTLKIWANNVIVTVAENKLPEEEWYITKAIARYKELHPNVDIQITNYGTENNALANDFKAAILAGTGPDIISPVSGPTMLSLKEGLLPLNDYIDDDLRNNFAGWDTCAENMDATKTIYALPYSGQSCCIFAYNKALVKNAGLDFENNAPKTIDEFYQALDAIKATGVEVMHADEGTDPMLALYDLVLWWVQKTTTPGILQHTFGDAKYADDEGLRFMLTEYQKFYQNGWVNEDVATSTESNEVFMQGKCALHYFNAGQLKDYRAALGDDLGIFSIPSAIETDKDKTNCIGGVGGCLAVSNFSEHQAEAIDFIKFLCTKEEMTEYNKGKSGIPSRLDLDMNEIGRDDPLFPEIVAMTKDIYYWPDNCMSLDAANVIYAQLGQCMVGNITPDELLQMLDEAQEE